MSFLRQRKTTSQIPLYTGLQIQTSSSAVPIQIVYGANKIAPNVIWTGGFSYTTEKTKAGKGGGSISGYDYRCGFALGLCEGPINAVGGVWSGQSITYLWNLGLGLFYGSMPQTPWGYLTASFPGQDLAYGGLAYVATASFDLGSSPSLPSLSFDVHGLLVGTGLINSWDANPALVIQDLLTNPQYGVGFPAASIDSTTLLGGSGGSSYQAYCTAAHLALSPVLANQEAASSILSRWLQLTNTAAVWSGGKLKFITYGDAPLTQSGVSFIPNVTPIYDLADDDFVISDDADPVEVVRSDPFTAKNWVTLEILDRNNWYDATPVQVWDQNAIELYGLHMDSSITAHEICDPSIGRISAQLLLQRSLYVRNTYQFKLGFEYCLLEPMDLVTISDVGLGMNKFPVRIVSIEEDGSGILSITAEDFTGGAATAAAYPVQAGSNTALDHGVSPSPVNQVIIFEPPPDLTNGVAEVWIAISGGLAPIYKLAEDGTTGNHEARWNGPVGAIGDIATITILIQAAERSAVSLRANDGVAISQCDFDLTGMTATQSTVGAFSAVSIVEGARGFKVISASVPLKAASTVPSFSLCLANPIGTISYAGAPGSGLYVWDVELATGLERLSASANAPELIGATIVATTLATPEGSAGAADPYWGGALVYLSTDNATYAQIGKISGPSRQGVLTASAPAPTGSNPDVANAISVDLAGSGGALASGTAADARNGVTICIVDHELFSYKTATLTGANTYALTYLERGLYGSVASSHNVNAPFARLDDSIFKYPLPAAFVGMPVYLKFPSFNIFGASVQDLSTCAVYTYTPVGSGISGPVAQALGVGAALDYGSAASGVNESDDFGVASDPYVVTIDLGLASA
ncbi:conserved hypothetical protein [Methylocella tundrae]|uniref:Tip attachment protein J domain-containing protein n=1 Tax=Methylocella tundrae TaxID=227605 RepID=A0A8B6M4L0_METTU|nr:phage tail protein [Methylocella tundrae]VTZ23248.1 conserved hypothetical protein [Methylocella tundrae]VTZ49250.1 conserved hypothetical protein [Methylocella tundrae]